jgi:glycosyltransferase involved in cell wall biosynthesis
VAKDSSIASTGAAGTSHESASTPVRILLVSSHPVQYAAPIFRLLAKDPRVAIQVAFCSMQSAEFHVDPGFGVEVKWDIPLFDGYKWTRVPNRSRKPSLDSFFGLFNPAIWGMISLEHFDAVVLYTGYRCATFWIALAAAKWRRVRVLYGTDAYDFEPRDRKRWKAWVKKLCWPALFSFADRVLMVSSGGVALMRSLGIPEDRIGLVPFCVDNDWWIEKSDGVDRVKVRSGWGVSEDDAVILFCGKLQPWKRPRDLLQAFAQVAGPDAYLVFAGDGPLRASLEAEAQTLAVGEKVRFLGFVNQSGLPEVYTASDLFVLPSEYEPFGLVVNEAMLCRCPAIVSDRVGARFDLVRDGETGYAYRCADVDALAGALRKALSDRPRLRRMGDSARGRMASWSPKEYVDGLVRAASKANARD